MVVCPVSLHVLCGLGEGIQPNRLESWLGACFGAIRPVGCQCPTVISCKTFTDRISGHSQGLEGIRFGGVRGILYLSTTCCTYTTTLSPPPMLLLNKYFLSNIHTLKDSSEINLGLGIEKPAFQLSDDLLYLLNQNRHTSSGA